MPKPIALVTGGAKRIGGEISRQLLDMGFHVIIHVNNSKLQAEILLQEKEYYSGEIIQANLLEEDGFNDLLMRVRELDKLTALIHNASFYKPIDFKQLSLQSLRDINRLHIEVPAMLTQASIPALQAGGGSVIAMVDTSLGRSWKDLSHYTSSKASLRQLMLNLAGDLQPEIRVNCIAPGAIMAAQWEAKEFAAYLEKVPLGRQGNAQDIAKAILFLINSPHINGQVIHVDGGHSLGA